MATWQMHFELYIIEFKLSHFKWQITDIILKSDLILCAYHYKFTSDKQRYAAG